MNDDLTSSLTPCGHDLCRDDDGHWNGCTYLWWIKDESNDEDAYAHARAYTDRYDGDGEDSDG